MREEIITKCLFVFAAYLTASRNAEHRIFGSYRVKDKGKNDTGLIEGRHLEELYLYDSVIFCVKIQITMRKPFAKALIKS
jgi:hypothetical protein